MRNVIMSEIVHKNDFDYSISIIKRETNTDVYVLEVRRIWGYMDDEYIISCRIDESGSGNIVERYTHTTYAFWFDMCKGLLDRFNKLKAFL